MSNILHACTQLGITLKRKPDGTLAPATDTFDTRTRDAAHNLASAILSERLVFITGTSGAGKSRLCKELARTLRDHKIPVVAPRLDQIDDRRAPVELLGRSAMTAMKRLARVGLGEAAPLYTPVRHLSDGQRARFAVALAQNAARRVLRAGAPRAVIIIDEFAGLLDTVTARTLATLVRRWTTNTRRITLVVASAADELLEPLTPDLVVLCHPAHPHEFIQ